MLVDADLQFGDVAVMLKLAPQHTIVDAVLPMVEPQATSGGGRPRSRGG